MDSLEHTHLEVAFSGVVILQCDPHDSIILGFMPYVSLPCSTTTGHTIDAIKKVQSDAVISMDVPLTTWWLPPHALSFGLYTLGNSYSILYDY